MTKANLSPNPIKQNTMFGIVLMLISTIAFAAMHACVRHLSDDLHPFEIAFFRNLFGVFMLAPWFIRFGLTPFHTQKLRLHFVRAGLNIFAMLSFFMAVSMTPLARVQALSFSAPLFATLLAIVLLRETVGLRRWLALIVGFAGAMIIIRPGLEAVDTGSLLVLFSAAVWAVTLIVIKTLSRTDSSVTITVYMVLLMTPLSFIPALFYWQWPTLGQLGWLVLVGIFGTAGQMLVAQSFRYAEATAVMPMDFMKLIWGALLGYLIFSEVPDSWTWLGGTVIFAGATYLTYREHQLKRDR